MENLHFPVCIWLPGQHDCRKPVRQGGLDAVFKKRFERIQLPWTLCSLLTCSPNNL
jgi:hypothetical protein